MSAILTKDRGIIRFTTVATSGVAAPRRDGTDWHARWILVFLVLGVAVRLIRYLLRFPLWGDEASLAMNFLDRDYAGLMQPLDFHQVAPLLFLWIELTAVKLLGFHEWSLRLFPLLCSIAGLFLFHRLARLLLRGTALVLAVGIFAVTYSSLRYAAEVKPYCVDLMVSTLLLLLAVRWWRQPGDARWLWALAAIVPLALGLSYPAVFVAGGVSLTVAAVLLGTRLRRGAGTIYASSWSAWVVYNLALLGSFFAWYQLAIRTQAGAELKAMFAIWADTFPPRDSLIHLLEWLVRVHAGPLLAVPVGGDRFGSIGTTLLCLVAVGVLIHRPPTADRRPPTADRCAVPGCPGARRYRLLVLCSAPFLLNLIAAALRQFPYGGHMRLAMHLSPLVTILAAIGATAILKWLGRSHLPSGAGTLRAGRNAVSSPHIPTSHARLRTIVPPGRRNLLGAAIVLLLALAVVSTARDFYSPGKEQQEIRKRDFAAWFWGSMEREHEVVCVYSDLKQTFPPPHCTWQNCVSPLFLCNERIYSPRLARGRNCDFSRVSRQRPLAVVQYWTHIAPYDQAAFDRWLDLQKQHYDLIATQRYPMLQDNDGDRAPEPPDRVEVYEFVPKG